MGRARACVHACPPAHPKGDFAYTILQKAHNVQLVTRRVHRATENRNGGSHRCLSEVDHHYHHDRHVSLYTVRTTQRSALSPGRSKRGREVENTNFRPTTKNVARGARTCCQLAVAFQTLLCVCVCVCVT